MQTAQARSFCLSAAPTCARRTDGVRGAGLCRSLRRSTASGPGPATDKEGHATRCGGCAYSSRFTERDMQLDMQLDMQFRSAVSNYTATSCGGCAMLQREQHNSGTAGD